VITSHFATSFEGERPPRSSTALRSVSAARHRALACSGRYRPPPRHANCNRRPAASPCGRARRSAAGAGRASWRGLCRCAWHRAQTRRPSDRRIRMTLADLTVDIVPIVRPIASKRGNRARNLLKQGTDLHAPVEADQAAVRDGDTVGVSGEIGEHRRPAMTWPRGAAAWVRVAPRRNQVRNRLTAGGGRIRTSGPPP
jgi:hypothetical protein